MNLKYLQVAIQVDTRALYPARQDLHAVCGRITPRQLAQCRQRRGAPRPFGAQILLPAGDEAKPWRNIGLEIMHFAIGVLREQIENYIPTGSR